jgi:hypothetical protein
MAAEWQRLAGGVLAVAVVLGVMMVTGRVRRWRK